MILGVTGWLSIVADAARLCAKRWGVAAGVLAAGVCGSARADVLSSPSMTAPLSANPNPYSLDAGPLGKIYVTGQITGLGLVQSDRTPNPLPGAGNSGALLDISNGQLEVQTTSGPLQVFLEAGAYSLPALGTPYIKAGKTVATDFGALPVAYAKIVATPDLSFQFGSLPTVIGAEYAFTFQNMNIERGLLWNQEPAISKGVQADYDNGPLSVSVSVNDGYDSDHYTWVSGLASYALDDENTVALDGGTHFARALDAKFRAPDTLNNSSILDASYTWAHKRWLVNPYLQYTRVDAEPSVGYTGARTYSGAVLAKYSLSPVFSLAARAEYVRSSSDRCGASDGVNCLETSVLYGPGSDAWSLTLTPTYQKGVVFARGEVSYTRIGHLTPGYGFGTDLDAHDQLRGLVETGLLF